MDYDVKVNSNDQNYQRGSYAALATSYRTKIDNALANAQNIHMETAAGNFFEAQYNSTSTNQTVSWANNGKTCSEILHLLNDNTTTSIGNISKGIIIIANYTEYVQHP